MTEFEEEYQFLKKWEPTIKLYCKLNNREFLSLNTLGRFLMLAPHSDDPTNQSISRYFSRFNDMYVIYKKYLPQLSYRTFCEVCSYYS